MKQTAHDERTWDLTHVYADEHAWEADRVALTERIPTLSRYRGRLGEHPGVLADAFDLLYSVSRQLETLYTFASLEADQDLRLPGPSGRRQRIEALMAEHGSSVCLVRP